MACPPATRRARARIEAGAVLHYADPEAYERRYANRTDDVTYYARLARRVRGDVLEYGCGTGRITLPLARAGVSVTGVDLSRAMLDHLRARLHGEPESVRHSVTLRHGDMRDVRFRRRFSLVIAPFNTFQHLYTREDVGAFLRRVRQHLAPGAPFVFDVYLPRADELEVDGHHSSYDPLRQVLRLRFTDDGSDHLSLRQFFPREVEMLLVYNGFGHVRIRADFTRNRLHPDATSMVISCRCVDPD